MADIAARKTGKLYMHISSCQSTSLETENEKKKNKKNRGGITRQGKVGGRGEEGGDPTGRRRCHECLLGCIPKVMVNRSPGEIGSVHPNINRIQVMVIQKRTQIPVQAKLHWVNTNLQISMGFSQAMWP